MFMYPPAIHFPFPGRCCIIPGVLHSVIFLWLYDTLYYHGSASWLLDIGLENYIPRSMILERGDEYSFCLEPVQLSFSSFYVQAIFMEMRPIGLRKKILSTVFYHF